MIYENVYKNIPRVSLETLEKVSDAFSLAAVDDFDPKGERDQKGIPWYRISRAVLMRDSYSCRICGKSDFSSLSGKSPHDSVHLSVQVHHIIPRKDKGANTFRNLITLCEECHRKTFSEGYSGLPLDLQMNLEWALEEINMCVPIELARNLGTEYEKVFISDFTRTRLEDNAVTAQRLIGQSMQCALISLQRSKYNQIVNSLADEYELVDYSTFWISPGRSKKSCRVLMTRSGYFL
jgi:5-methylcytosine-specific restriction endonuclease McrA